MLMGLSRLLLPRFRNDSFSSIFFQSLRSFSSSASFIRWPGTYDLGELEESNGESAVYRRALRLQRPTTVKFQKNMLNSVSLIGFISAPFRDCRTASGRFGVYTILKVDSSARAFSDFGVMLKFWNEMAEIAVEHLKMSDLIYVLGSLVSYEKMDWDWKSINYQVTVTGVNFITQHAPVPACQNSLKLDPKVSWEDILRIRRARLHLWQVFFASPDEWWDNRNSKRNPKHPDFKHKDTGEALWLQDTDPDWVKKQLLLLDSRLKNQRYRKHTNSLSHLSPFGLP